MAAMATIAMTASASAQPVSFRDLLARERPAPSQTIAYGPSTHQRAELWLPKDAGPHRTIVLIHGGCWLAALPGPELMAHVAEDLRANGYAVWNITYRRIGHEGGGYPGTFLDAAAAIDKLKEIAPAHKLDLRKVLAVGHSAGGALAAWGAGRPRLPKTSPLAKADPLPIAAVVTLAGINDLEHFRADGPSACGGPPTIDALVGASERKGRNVYADTSPAALLPLGVKQVILSAPFDTIVPPQFGQDYAAKALAAGDTATEMTLDGGHFELIDPTSAAWAQIRTEIDALMK